MVRPQVAITVQLWACSLRDSIEMTGTVFGRGLNDVAALPALNSFFFCSYVTNATPARTRQRRCQQFVVVVARLCRCRGQSIFGRVSFFVSIIKYPVIDYCTVRVLSIC